MSKDFCARHYNVFLTKAPSRNAFESGAKDSTAELRGTMKEAYRQN
jgi:hypothetical protein